MIEYQPGVRLLRQNMVKIALCISGQPRSVDLAFPFVKKNILDGNDVTVFTFSWGKDTDDGNKKIVELYKPARSVVVEQIVPDLSKYTRFPPPQPNWKVKDPKLSTWSQLYAIQRCNELKSEHELTSKIKFDWVIRTRFDFAINALIPFNELDNSKLYIPNCRMTPARDFGNDQFAFSSSKNMDEYSRCFEHIEEFYESGVQYMCEDFMGANWTQYGLIGEKLVYCDVNHPFPPGQYNGTWHSLIREDFEEWLR